jgi:thymidylate synthase ThyX
MLQANWGDAPSRTIDARDQYVTDLTMDWITGWSRLTPGQQDYLDSCFAGKTLPQARELITFSFLIDGCTRASTHQIVRHRMGLPGFMQHGGRDNDWRHRPWVMPETIRRACERQHGGTDHIPRQDLLHCITDWKPIMDFLHSDEACGASAMMIPSLEEAIHAYLNLGRMLYSALVDAGIPWEDARRVLWMGTSTYIHGVFNYNALESMLAKRLEYVMDHEINCIAQLMKREVVMHCPPILSKYLGSTSDKLGRAAFAGLESWPPDGKYPNPFEKDGKDTLPREHRPEQNPFWILHPDSMAGGPIRWIPTNGVFPEEAR